MSKLVERGYFTSEIKLSDAHAGAPNSASPRVQILRVGAFNHPKYGEFKITPKVLAEMKRNFDAGIRGIDIALDYFHKSDEEASGWLKSLSLEEDGSELWGEVDWTPKAGKMLSEREIRYFSPDFAFEWTDPETEITYQNVLFGGGLTNRPFVKDMAAIVASERGETMDLKELEKKVVKLAEDHEDLAKKHGDLQKAHADLQAKHADAMKKLEEMDEDGDDDSEEDSDEPADLPAAKKMLGEMKKKLAEYEEKAQKAEEAKQMAEKESKFNVMLSEGKAVAAQKDAFMKGDMMKFAELAQPVNIGGKGHGGGGKENDGTKGDREDRVLKLAEDKCKADPKLKLHDAISLAQREIKE